MPYNVDVQIRLFASALLTVICGLSLETKLLTEQEVNKRVRMIRITDFAKFPLTLRTEDFELGSGGGDALFWLRGHDRLGKHWRLVLNDAVRGAWSSDLNGARTYYFAGYTGGTGSAPGTWILALSFDEQRRPVPFFVVTHGGYDEQGIQDVLNLDGTGPELLQQDYWGNVMDDPGYYVTTMYVQRKYYWYRSDGIHGVHTFPTFEKWSVMWRGRPAALVERPQTDRLVRDWGNDHGTGVRTQIVGTGENGVLHIRPGLGCTDVRVDTAVEDSPNGREITMGAYPRVDTLVKARSTVTLTGLYRWPHGECDAAILWTNQ